MSSNTVREAFRSAWPTLTPTLPYIETLNVPISDADAEALPEVWGSIAFSAERDSAITMGSRPWYEETGIASVMIFAKAGRGDLAAAAMAEQVKVAWSAWINPTSNVWVRETAGPRPYLDSSVGNWLVITVDLSYIYQRRTP